MTISEQDVAVVSVVVGVGGNPAVSCDTGVSERGSDLFHVADAGNPACFFAGRVQSGEQHSGEDRDNHDDDNEKKKGCQNRSSDSPYQTLTYKS